MNNYNDFPTLSNEQYEELNKQYNSSREHAKTPTTIASKLQFCINSFAMMQTNFNKPLQQQISFTIKELQSVKESIKILYPSLQFSSNSVNQNIFAVLKSLADICIDFSKEINKTEKEYYKTMLSKLNTQVLNCISLLMLTISKQDIKFFKFM